MNVRISKEQAKKLRETNAFDPRNVRDHLKHIATEDIRKLLGESSSDFILCLSNNIRDMNLSSAIRSANAFNVQKTVLVGRKTYDRRGACGAQNYSIIEHMENWYDLFAQCREEDYTIVALEYDENYEMKSLPDYEWNKKTLMICGEEGYSIPDEILKAVDDIVYIPMFGSVRSLNLASAASIAMYDYMSKEKE